MDVLVNLQSLEQYGSHTSPHWKFKGGSTVIVTRCHKEADAVALLVAIRASGLSYLEVPVSWKAVDPSDEYWVGPADTYEAFNDPKRVDEHIDYEVEIGKRS